MLSFIASPALPRRFRRTKLGPYLVALAIPLAFAVAQVQAQQSFQTLRNHVRTAVTTRQAQLVGSLPSGQKLHLSIVLPLRNQAELTSLLSRLYDPSSPDYRRFLSVEQFTEQFGPTVADFQAVVDFAQANGLTVTDTPANRLVVPVSGSVSQIEKAFSIRMNVYQHPTENRTFFSSDREPSLNLNVPVAHIAGLNNFSVPRPMVTSGPQEQVTANVTGSGPGGYYLASDMRAAYYGGTDLTGNGQTVGLLEFGGYNLSDVNMAFSSVGQTYTVPINNVLLDGATATPYGSDSEEVLDIVQAIGMAPGLSQVRVYIGNSDVDIFNRMATENIAKQLSVSWGWSPDDSAADDVFFQEFAAQGQTLFVASGDHGAFDPQINSCFFPSEDPYITAVGATHLTTSGPGGEVVSEAAWNLDGHGSGGGISPDGIAIPGWQAGIANASNSGSTTLRNIPDVAMEGDFDNYNCNMGACGGGWAGTSFAAPRWAGFMALVNQQAVEVGAAPAGGLGFINSALYAIGQGSSYDSDFHDVTGGNNDTENQPVSYSAVAGYDLVTGWGSPNGQNLIDALAGPRSTESSIPALLSPVGGSTLSGSTATFQWSIGRGVTANDLWLGTTGVGSYNLYNGSTTTATSVTVTGLPTTGVTIYARLSSLINGVWQPIDYTYTAYGTPTPAMLTSPTPGSTFATSSQLFTWSAGNGASVYGLWVGTTGVGSSDVYNGGTTTATSATVTGLPTADATLYVRLSSKVNGTWQHFDYTYSTPTQPRLRWRSRLPHRPVHLPFRAGCLPGQPAAELACTTTARNYGSGIEQTVQRR